MLVCRCGHVSCDFFVSNRTDFRFFSRSSRGCARSHRRCGKMNLNLNFHTNRKCARNPHSTSQASRYTSRCVSQNFSPRPHRRSGSGGLPRTHHARPGSAHDGERVTAPEDPRKAPDHSQDARSHGTRRRCALDPRAARDSDAVRDAEKTSPPTLVLTARPISYQQQPRRTLSRRPRRLLSRRSRRRSRYVTPSSHQSDPRRARSILAPRHASQLPFACRVFGAAVRRRPRGARSRWKFRASRRTPRPSIRT